MKILNLFWFSALRGFFFHTTIPPQIISMMSMNKATEYSTPYLISFIEKIQTLPKFSSTTCTALARVTTNEKCFIHEIMSDEIRKLRSIGVQNTGLLTKKCFQLTIRQIKVKQHTISSVVVLKAFSCHQVERLLHLHSGMRKNLVTLTQNLKNCV